MCDLRIKSDGSWHGNAMLCAVEKLVATCQPANHDDATTIERLSLDIERLAVDLRRLGRLTCVRPQTSVTYAVQTIEAREAEVRGLEKRVLDMEETIKTLLDALHESNVRVTPLEGIKIREIMDEYVEAWRSWR